MDINLKDVQKWYADKTNKQVIELDRYDLFCAKVAYDYACEQLIIPAVVGRSEQLNAFVDFYNNRKLSHERINYDEIEIFLESI